MKAEALWNISANRAIFMQHFESIDLLVSVTLDLRPSPVVSSMHGDISYLCFISLQLQVKAKPLHVLRPPVLSRSHRPFIPTTPNLRRPRYPVRFQLSLINCILVPAKSTAVCYYRGIEPLRQLQAVCSPGKATTRPAVGYGYLAGRRPVFLVRKAPTPVLKGLFGGHLLPGHSSLFRWPATLRPLRPRILFGNVDTL